MPRYIAVHTVSMGEEDFKNSAKQLASQCPAGVIWKQTWCDFAGGKFFCEWEAPSKEAIEKTFEAVKLPFDAIYQVRLYDVASDKLEP